MTGKVLNLTDFMTPDQLGCRIAQQWQEWNNLRQDWLTEKRELRAYIFATDTRKTSNASLPWKNTTTIPKICQIRDNLEANYYASSFPKMKWMDWQAEQEDANDQVKRDNILNYMRWATSHDRFKTEMKKCILDYIDYGNCFSTVEWIDQRVTLEDGRTQVGFVGPTIRRISPLDIVMNPTAPTFREAPKIVRSIVSLGEVKKILDSQSTDQNRQEYEELYKYLIKIRQTAREFAGDFQGFDQSYQVDGFSSYRNYLISDMVEILTFYGDAYDWNTNTLLTNHIITVVDRHKVIGKRPNPSYFGYAPIFHVGWRPRQDNLWAMGPLDNLVGMQYRLDHVENLKADVFDLNAFPPLKIKGYVEDFKWGPMERIYLGDDGDIEMMAPAWNILAVNSEIQYLMQTMEEMAGAPREAMGIRSPGEKTAYEVQKLDNASSRIFNNKTIQYDEQFTELNLNAMLELARRNISSTQTISIFDDEFDIQIFMSLTPQDITGAGRLKPIGARHFAEQAELLQNLNNFFNSGVGQDPAVLAHFSTVQIAKLIEHIFDIKDFAIVKPFIRLSEEADGQRLAQAHQEQVSMESQTPAGLTPDDHDPDVDGVPEAPPAELDGSPAPGIPQR